MGLLMHKIGACHNCGACCYVLFPDGKYRICQHYNIHSNLHCKLYGKKERPKDCINFPRGPMDLERVKKWCGFRFVDDKGCTVDGYMDKRVTLQRLTV